MSSSFSVRVPENFSGYADQAILRLHYLFPEASLELVDGSIVVLPGDAARITAKEVTHQLYREKIYQESLPLREMMYRAVLT